MLLNHDVEIDKFLQLTSAGLQVASFAEIREAVINEYKKVYGSDIDLSTANVDGIWINNMCLIINNICQTCASLYGNLDVNTATGVYLDNLCRLANITRKAATYSTATLNLENNGSGSVTVDTNSEFIDGSGMIWKFVPANASVRNIEIAAGQTSVIQVKCSEAGKVEAPAGWISIWSTEPNVVVTQVADAIVGLNEETDQELRARRYQASGGDGQTTLDNLLTALFDLSYVKDIKLYNGNKISGETASDSTVIPLGTVYAIIRMHNGYSTKTTGNVDPAEIGTLLYNKLTPGVTTVQSAVIADSVGYTIVPEISGQFIDALQTFIYWREASSINPTLTIKLTATNYSTFGASKGEGEEQEIFESIRDWANELSLGTQITQYDLISQILDADPENQGRKTFTISEVTVASHSNADMYYNYTDYVYVKSNDTITITMS